MSLSTIIHLINDYENRIKNLENNSIAINNSSDILDLQNRELYQ